MRLRWQADLFREPNVLTVMGAKRYWPTMFTYISSLREAASSAIIVTITIIVIRKMAVTIYIHGPGVSAS